MQACEWLKIHLTSRMPSVDTTTMQDPRFGNTLELAVRFGKTLIIQVNKGGPWSFKQVGTKRVEDSTLRAFEGYGYIF